MAQPQGCCLGNFAPLVNQYQQQGVPSDGQVPWPLLRAHPSFSGPSGIFLILIFTHLTLARKKDLDQPVDSVPLKAAV